MITINLEQNYLFVYQGQKMHLFSESEFSAKAQPRLKQARAIGTFWKRCTLNFLGDHTNYKAEDIIGKFTNLFCIYLFQINKFINTYYNFFL
jgi:hypothetical protein